MILDIYYSVYTVFILQELTRNFNQKELPIDGDQYDLYMRVRNSGARMWGTGKQIVILFIYTPASSNCLSALIESSSPCAAPFVHHSLAFE